MKKIILFLLFLVPVLLSAETYKISKVNYTIEGCGWQIFSKTKDYSVEINVPVDKRKIFKSREEFDEYMKEYNQRLENTRAFEKIEISPVFPEELSEETENIVEINLFLKDTFHILGVPYPKYDSNRGLDLKLKIKDTNFLGSLNTMSADIFFLLTTNDQNNNNENHGNQLGFNFNFDYPFPLGKLNATWVNSDEFHYEFGNSMPEWNLKTGLALSLPFYKNSLKWEFYQYSINNLDYENLNDFMYFIEEGKFSSDLRICTLKNNSNVTYTPYIKAVYNWDKDGISSENPDLYGTRLSIGHSVSNSKIDWSNDFRKGYSATISNDYVFNCSTVDFSPSLALTLALYDYRSFFDITKSNWETLKYFGFTTRLYTLFNISSKSDVYLPSMGTNIGTYLRGVRDEQLYSDESLGYLCKTNSAIILNLDFPFQVLKTSFKHNIINFNMQFVPFVDIALIQNKSTHTTFNPKDGLYSAGMEVLVYPAKLKSMTIRGSLGLDLRRLYKKLAKVTDSDFMIDGISPVEISFGVGVFY